MTLSLFALWAINESRALDLVVLAFVLWLSAAAYR